MVTSRKKNRLELFLYREGYFFVTINVHEHKKVLGEVIGENMVLNTYGEIIKECRLWLREQYPYISLGEFVIMPNHFHGIISIESVGNGRDRSLHSKQKGLSGLIGAFKMTSSKKIHEAGFADFKRQKSFYDHIIRNEEDFQSIQEYIENNPYKRENDEYYK